ncbi:hypothetical protein SAMN04489723_10712 [Algoriphagus aquimarinus]|uniref:Uncharacterized protein n=1 Tax=Algoriphagus aquimarinus TaxID=237018 RepID=A0A1I1A0M3_9BACT|nr:hypothetical protein SAMN04489723_10712 [Algoriphagus aquimarinus]
MKFWGSIMSELYRVPKARSVKHKVSIVLNRRRERGGNVEGAVYFDK